MKHKFDLGFYRLLTGNLGKLYPVGVVEVLPGDVFQHSASTVIRLSPLAAPVMHPMQVRLNHHFVPHRLSWPKDYEVSFEDFITGGPSNDVTTPVPTIETTGIAKDLLDFLGLPVVAGVDVSSLPLRAFNLIFNEWYRDQDLVPERGLEDLDIPNIAWAKDYFTTARPWPQKGEDVTLPLGTLAPITGLAVQGGPTFSTNATAATPISGGTATDTTPRHGIPGDFLRMEVDANQNPAVFADLSEAAAAKVNDIRRAFALQRFAEVRARFGSRYAEYLEYLGVRSPDARLQRPEFLAGGTARVSISEVLQTAPDDSVDPRFGVGDMYGHGIASGGSNRYRKRFVEHGYVITTMSLRPKQMFTQGVERTFLRRDREDFWQRELQHIGQQQVLQQELYADATNQDTVFGYSDRYAEYRSTRSSVTGEFRDVLDYWHLARKFDTAPVLNEDFIKCQPSARIFNEQTMDQLWCAVNHRLIARRLVTRNASGRIM